MKSSYGTLASVVVVTAVALAVIISCNSSPTHNAGNSAYAVAGAAIADANHDSTKVVVSLRKDQVRYGSAVVMFSADSLKYRRSGFPIDSVYSLVKQSRLYYGVGKYKLIVQDSTLFADSAAVRMSDTFRITSIIPTNRLAQGLRSVTLEWAGADSADGYVMAATPRDSVYRGYGYSLYPGTQGTAGTIPPDAFSLSPGTLPDTGWYYLYVYAFTGAPDSVLTAKLLPVPFPEQIADNIGNSNFAGHFGTVRIIRHDSVHVVTN